MKTEDKIFNKYKPDFGKLEKYGFVFQNGKFFIEKPFKNNLFKAVVTVAKTGRVKVKVIDSESGDEFLPLRVENAQGSFIGEVRESYEKFLTDIRDKCFTQTFFMYPQSNEITKKLIELYGNYPEFLWKTSPGSGIFRNKESKKWYLAILDVEGEKIDKNLKCIVEVANIKLPPEKISELIQKEHFYPAYHMNKKYWMTIVLNNSVPNNVLLDLISQSRELTL